MKIFLFAFLFSLVSCAKSQNQCKAPPEPPAGKSPAMNLTVTQKKPATVKKTAKERPMDAASVKKVIATLSGKYPAHADRIRRGVTQIAALWRTDSDGNAKAFEKFCTTSFASDEKARAALFARLEKNMETLRGHHTRITLELNMPIHVEMGPMLPIDKLFGAYSPSAHLEEDLYRSKIGFIVALNFPAYSLREKNTLGPKWSRTQWAYARMGDLFTERVPAKVKQDISTAMTEADDYISHYNIFMGKLVDDAFKSFFPEKMKLITHWNLRDELKSQYAGKAAGLRKQRLIYAVMKRIIDQSIPARVVNKGELQWNPVTNKLYKDKKEVTFKREPDTRYAYLLKNFHAMRAYDPYSPTYPTYVERAFDRDLEYSFEEIERLFTSLVGSPETAKVGALIVKRLGRKLEPFDIWYDGFKARAGIN
ncbi:hypothetical protein KJ865_07430, partial [Myxococcota bacterium]|nr:hypothetical protein [Myxococcota bacterium]